MTRSRGFRPLRDLPALLWLLLTVVVAFVHPFVPAPRWLMVHLLLLGAVTHSILVWSQHFADALLHTPTRPGDARRRSTRLALLNGGVVVVVSGVVAELWPVTAVGAAAVTVAVADHGISLVRQMRRALPARFGMTVRYYVAAAALLPVGALLGVLMARGLGEPWHAQVVLAHETVNVLGWMGLTVVGTLVTLWPTMLRTRVPEGAESAAARGLAVLVAGVLATAGAALVGSPLGAGLGLLLYLAGLLVVGRPFVVAALTKPPAHFPTWSVLAGVAWLVTSVAVLGGAVLTAGSWADVHDRVGWMTPALAAGFGAQVLLGALSYLVPVALGGGPSPARAANTVLDRAGAFRVVLVNAALVVCLLPVPPLVRVACSVLVLVGLASFVPLLVLSVRASRRARAAAGTEAGALTPGPRRGGPAPVAAERPRGQLAGLAVGGLVTVLLATVLGVALDPAALGVRTASASDGVTATGETTRVVVRAADMRFTPSTVEVPAGNRLVIELRNTDDGDVHDLVLDSGADSGRLAPGERAVLDVGVVGRDLDGWCSVVGHRQQGMTLRVVAVGAQSPSDGHDHEQAAPPADDHGDEHAHGSPPVRVTPEPDDDFEAHDATLPPLPEGRVHRETIVMSEVDTEVAPGVTQHLWLYDGTMPGPTLRGRIGDRFVVTLVNDGSIGHSIDFHAGALAPDRPMRTLQPGERLTYRFTAARAGIWMYHCSTMPMTAHIANGMFGAVVIEPRGLPRVDREYLLVQSELYLGEDGGVVDMDELQAERPDLVVFNGYANQYDHRPLPARAGERVRFWVLDAGPSRASSFHVVGGQFDTVWTEGDYTLRPGNRSGGGAQVLPLLPAQGGFVELELPEPGHYPFVSHVMVDAERGAHGVLEVGPARR